VKNGHFQGENGLGNYSHPITSLGNLGHHPNSLATNAPKQTSNSLTKALRVHFQAFCGVFVLFCGWKRREVCRNATFSKAKT